MNAQRLDFHGMDCIQLENDFISVVLALQSGDILDYLNKQTGHHQFWVAEDSMVAQSYKYGIQLPWIAKPELVGEPTCDDGECWVEMRATTKTLTQTFKFGLAADTAALRLTHNIENISDQVQTPDPRIFYHLNVASQAEKSGILSGSGPKFNNITVPHGKHRFFVGKECEWPGDGYWENHEAGQDVFEPSAFRTRVWTRPRWFAVVDAEVREGIAVRFHQPAGFVRSMMPGFAFAQAVTVEQDFSIGELQPRESASFQMDIAAISGLSRVDHIGPTYALEIDLTAGLRLEEQQDVTVRASAFAPGSAKGQFIVRTNKVELEREIELAIGGVGQTAQETWRGGPFGSKEWLEAIWYYVDKKPGDVGRPTPRVELQMEGDRVDRWFAPSPENEEILERLERQVDVMSGRVASDEVPRELESALRGFLEQANELRRERIDPDAMYVLLDRAECVGEVQIPKDGFDLFDRDEIRSAADDETASSLLTKAREDVLAQGDSFYALAAPGRRAYMPSFDLAPHAAYAAICYACYADRECGERARRALMVFADDFERYHLTGAGNILHLSGVVPSLITAYDLVRELFAPEQEVKLLRYFFWLADLLEGHVNAKGDNDEIHESGAIAWLAARFPYLPDSRRKLRRAHAVLCRQAHAINEEGGWPESPNYNTQITIAYMGHAHLMKRTGMPIHTGDTGKAIRLLLDWLIQILTPDYRIPMLGDGVNRRPLSDTFFLGASLFDDGRYLAVARKLLAYEQKEGIELPGQFGPLALLTYPASLSPQKVELPLVSTLPATGYLLLRSSQEPEAEFLISDYGPHKPGHGHMDKLSFEFYAFRENLIRDTGYGMGATEHHNLVVVDGEGQERLCGKLESLETEADGVVRAIVSAETSPGVTHTRQFIYSPSKWLLVHDSRFPGLGRRARILVASSLQWNS